jgi:polyvinyl alcohol dehydrogenase (cytochrome)
MARPLPSVATAGALVFGLAVVPAPAPADPGFLLYNTEGNRLRRFDIDTIGTGALEEDILVDRASASEDSGADPAGSFRDMNGMICLFPDGSGRFVNGEDTGQPSPPPGWGVFLPDGEQVGKLTATYFVAQAEPFGCAFAPDGTLFTTEVGTQGFGTPNGQLIMWFPPYDRFPGPPGAYPDTDERSTNFCKIATDIGTAGGVAVDRQGRVYVAGSSSLSVFRFSPPFPTSPDAAGGCGATDALGSPMAAAVSRDTFIPPTGLTTFSGLAFAPNGNLYAASVFTGDIFEYDLTGNFVRMILDPPEELPPVSTGNPQGLAVDAAGTLYYADLDLVGSLPDVGPGPNGKVRRIRFDSSNDPLPPEIVREDLSFPDGVSVFPGELGPGEWRTYGGGESRRFFNPSPSALTAANVDRLTVKWRFDTGAIVTASPTVARVTVPGEGRIAVAYVQSWDSNVYAIRVRDGSELWRFAAAPQPGAPFPNAGSAHVENIDGQDRVFVGAGEFMYSLDAASGEEIWRFAAGTGCGEPPGLCAFDGERNEIESSPIVADGTVFFGMDVNEFVGAKGGFFALDAADGRLRWFFDLESGSTCTPLVTDDIRRFDGYHSAAELGLPADFFSTRPGCDFDRTGTGCANVWSSPAVDFSRGQLYVASSNCETDTLPATDRPPPPMPPYDEAIFALDFAGTPVWRWRPREVDNDDLAFGAVPNLFTAVIAGREREVVGIGNKDGTYYLLDRDGENELTGIRWNDANRSALPYWSTRVVPGGFAGGIIGTPAVDDAADRIYFGTAPGTGDPFSPQRPTVHALDAGTGAVLWQNTAETDADTTFAPTTAVPGIVFAGSVVSGHLRFYDATDGTKLGAVSTGGFAVASGAAVIDGVVIVGAGVGQRSADPANPSDAASRVPQPVTAFCVPGTSACTVDVPVSGRRLRVVDKDQRPASRRLGLLLSDTRIASPPADDTQAPTQVGLVLELLNPVGGETQTVRLPAEGWAPRKGKPRGANGYRYLDRAGEMGPCRGAVLAPGKFRARCTGEALTFTLDEGSQEALAVAITLTGETTYCARFGGTVNRDTPATGGRRGAFVASGAPVPVACPLP